jgi:hypothetical protein
LRLAAQGADVKSENIGEFSWQEEAVAGKP